MRAGPPSSPHQCRGTLWPPPPGPRATLHTEGASQQRRARGLRPPGCPRAEPPHPAPHSAHVPPAVSAPVRPAWTPLARGSLRDHRAAPLRPRRGCGGGGRGRAGAPGRELPLSLLGSGSRARASPPLAPPSSPRSQQWFIVPAGPAAAGSPSGSPPGPPRGPQPARGAATAGAAAGALRSPAAPGDTGGDCPALPAGICGGCPGPARGTAGLPAPVPEPGTASPRPPPVPEPGTASLRPPRERPRQGTTKGHQTEHRALWPCKDRSKGPVRWQDTQGATRPAGTGSRGH